MNVGRIRLAASNEAYTCDKRERAVDTGGGREEDERLLASIGQGRSFSRCESIDAK